jgi:membrane-associated protein
MLDAHNVLQAGSLIVIAAVIFAESGLLLGLFFPGDTLLIAGGIFAAEGKLPLSWLIIMVATATILGYQLGYYLGRTAGPRMFKRHEGVLFREDYLASTESFFKRRGWQAILLARFIAIIRTVAPLVAGVGKMNLQLFTIFNVIGGVIWSASLILLSYYVGRKVPNLDSYIKYFVLLAIVLTFGSVVYELMKNKQKRREVLSAIREELKVLVSKRRPGSGR